jgi:AcrR family transcriptional regulator
MARAGEAAQATTATSFADRRRLRAERAEAVLDAAVAVFSARGYHDASMDAIAARAGVSKPAVYSHYGSKDELYVACIERAAGKFHDALEAGVLAAGGPQERMWSGIIILLDHVERERGEWSMLFEGGALPPGPISTETAAVRARTTALIAKLFTDTAERAGIAGSAIDAMEPLGSAFVGTAEGLIRWWLAHPGAPKGSVAMYFMNYVWSGLGGLIEGRIWMPQE